MFSIHKKLFLALKKIDWSKSLLLRFSPPGKKIPPTPQLPLLITFENPDDGC